MPASMSRWPLSVDLAGALHWGRMHSREGAAVSGRPAHSCVERIVPMVCASPLQPRLRDRRSEMAALHSGVDGTGDEFLHDLVRSPVNLLHSGVGVKPCNGKLHHVAVAAAMAVHPRHCRPNAPLTQPRPELSTAPRTHHRRSARGSGWVPAEPICRRRLRQVVCCSGRRTTAGGRRQEAD